MLYLIIEFVGGDIDLEYLFREWRKNESWILFCPMAMRFNLVNREAVNRVKTPNYGRFSATLEFANTEYWGGILEIEEDCSISFKDAIWEVVGIGARGLKNDSVCYLVEWKAQNGRFHDG